MAGLNRALSLDESLIKSHIANKVKCVFISHQKDDSEKCRLIARYIMNANIDVYFDEHDNDLKNYRQTNNPEGVVNSIKAGINKSSHMLCVISPNTIYSRWGPWEIGYGYENTIIGALTLKGINQTDLPDYLKTVHLLRGTKSLNEFIVELTGLTQFILEIRNFSESYSKPNHSLDNVLDWAL